MPNAGFIETPISPIELDWFAENDRVSVTPRNQKRFEIQKDRAIAILQREKDKELFGQQFALLLERLAQWVKTQQEKISRAIVTLQDGTLVFIVMQAATAYDPILQDNLAEIDFEIANDPDLDLTQLKTIMLPKVGDEALLSFLDARLALEYHGK